MTHPIIIKSVKSLNDIKCHMNQFSLYNLVLAGMIRNDIEKIQHDLMAIPSELNTSEAQLRNWGLERAAIFAEKNDEHRIACEIRALKTEDAS